MHSYDQSRFCLLVTSPDHETRRETPAGQFRSLVIAQQIRAIVYFAAYKHVLC